VGYRAPLQAGDAGTEQTIKLMRQLVDEDLANSRFVNFARSLVAHVPAHDEYSEVEAVYDWVHSNIRFVKDPVTKEVLVPPSEILKSRQDDCDGISMLLGALYLAIGYNARLVTVAANNQAPDEFSHVYIEVEVPPGSDNWIAADAARAGAQFGEHPPQYYRRRAWSLTDDSFQDLGRLRGALGYIRYRTLGYGHHLGQDDGGGFDWSSIIQTGIQETPTIIAEATQQPVRVTGPGGTFQTTSPYGSFYTPYTPGYGLNQAGYPYSSSVGIGATSMWPMLLIGGVVVVALMMRKKS
jgi:hypothetical protein